MVRRCQGNRGGIRSLLGYATWYWSLAGLGCAKQSVSRLQASHPALQQAEVPTAETSTSDERRRGEAVTGGVELATEAARGGVAANAPLRDAATTRRAAAGRPMAAHRVAAVAGADGVMLQAVAPRRSPDKAHRASHGGESPKPFRSADEDLSGSVDAAEFANYLRLRGVPEHIARRLFASLDEDLSGSLSEAEFGRHPRFGRAVDAVRIADSDLDGVVNHQEMKAMFERARTAFLLAEQLRSMPALSARPKRERPDRLELAASSDEAVSGYGLDYSADYGSGEAEAYDYVQQW
eukprot:TRINITY_DN112153_c0_g1_i1.p1 TRINITY_DN112153_c0_g1~~TRINITY_DN112153_c0_g1_i1.p1  ORF type:complete len:294 (-),score=49.55 TRINITY_DN112153_c0_g1_i1:31-912(-)